ncbi:hypothetical protein DITRI_Ditri03aG0139200 [Diplodiscus trichospermus]
MGSRKLLVLVLWLLLLLFIYLLGQAHGSSPRYSHMLKVKKPKSHQSSPRSFLGALPKTIPIPPSGPSKKHNDIGLQNSRRFP